MRTNEGSVFGYPHPEYFPGRGPRSNERGRTKREQPPVLCKCRYGQRGKTLFPPADCALNEIETWRRTRRRKKAATVTWTSYPTSLSLNVFYCARQSNRHLAAPLCPEWTHVPPSVRGIFFVPPPVMPCRDETALHRGREGGSGKQEKRRPRAALRRMKTS